MNDCRRSRPRLVPDVSHSKGVAACQPTADMLTTAGPFWARDAEQSKATSPNRCPGPDASMPRSMHFCRCMSVRIRHMRRSALYRHVLGHLDVETVISRGTHVATCSSILTLVSARTHPFCCLKRSVDPANSGCRSLGKLVSRMKRLACGF